MTRRGIRHPACRAVLVFLVLVVLVLPALDLAWNELRLADRQGTPCPFHANPVLGACPAALETGQVSQPGEVLAEPLRPQLYDVPIFVPPKL